MNRGRPNKTCELRFWCSDYDLPATLSPPSVLIFYFLLAALYLAPSIMLSPASPSLPPSRRPSAGVPGGIDQVLIAQPACHSRASRPPPCHSVRLPRVIVSAGAVASCPRVTDS